jgi:hypothetical protein
MNRTVESVLLHAKFIDLQFIFIKSNYSPDALLTNFDIDVTQFSFNGETLKATMAAIQPIQTSSIINYALNNDDKDYVPISIRIGKYIKHGFKFLTPRHFNMKRFEASPTHINNQHILVHEQEHHGYDNSSIVELSFHLCDNLQQCSYVFV